MKVFQSDKEYGGKNNFVDRNNVFVGYDTEQDCCEDADWFISDKVEKELPETNQHDIDLSGYVFDTTYFKENSEIQGDLDEGECVVFKLIKGNSELFLHLYNCHNGYYSHGFEMKIGDEIIKEGYL